MIHKVTFNWCWSKWEWGLDRDYFVTFVDIGPLYIGLHWKR